MQPWLSCFINTVQEESGSCPVIEIQLQVNTNTLMGMCTLTNCKGLENNHVTGSLWFTLTVLSSIKQFV